MTSKRTKQAPAKAAAEPRDDLAKDMQAALDAAGVDAKVSMATVDGDHIVWSGTVGKGKEPWADRVQVMGDPDEASIAAAVTSAAEALSRRLMRAADGR